MSEIEAGSVQLDFPLSVFLTQEIGYDILVNWNCKMPNGKVIRKQEQYISGCANAEEISIDYFGNGSGGHYQAIIPIGMNVRFD
jgi:hypothetical protein